jgi:hypothetical protein
MDNDNNIPTSKENTSTTYEVIPLPPEEPINPSKTGNKPKQLKAMEVYGYEVGRGLNKRIVNPDQIYELAAIGCTDIDIARWFDIDESTLRYNFSDMMIKGREDVKMSLRRAQLQLALNGNPTMLIWLGKQLLGQQDAPTNAQDQAPLPWNDSPVNDTGNEV